MSLSLKQKPKVLCFVGNDPIHISSKDKLPTESKLEVFDAQDQYQAAQLFQQIIDRDDDYHNDEDTPYGVAKDSDDDDEEMVSVTKVLQGLRAKANIRKYNISIESISSLQEMCNNNYQHQHYQHKEGSNDIDQNQLIPDYQYQQQRQLNNSKTTKQHQSLKIAQENNTHNVTTIPDNNNSSSNNLILNPQQQLHNTIISNTSVTIPTEESRFSKIATADNIINPQIQQPLSRMPLSDISTAVSKHSMNKYNTLNNNTNCIMVNNQISQLSQLDQQKYIKQDISPQNQGSFLVKESDKYTDHQYSKNQLNSVYFKETLDNNCKRQDTEDDTSSIPSESDQIATYEAYSYRRESKDIMIIKSQSNNSMNQKQLSSDNIQISNTAANSNPAIPLLTSPTNKTNCIKGIALTNSQQCQRQSTSFKYPQTTAIVSSTAQLLSQQRKNSNQRNTYSSNISTPILNTSATRSSHRTEKSPCTSDRFSKLLAKIQSKDNPTQESLSGVATKTQSGIDSAYSPLSYISQQEVLPSQINNGQQQQQQQYGIQGKTNRSGLLYHHQQQQSIKHSKAVTQNIVQISQHLIDLQKNNKTINNNNNNSSNSLSPYHSNYLMKNSLNNNNINYQNNNNGNSSTPTNARTNQNNNSITSGKENIDDSNQIKQTVVMKEQLKSSVATAATISTNAPIKQQTTPNGVRLSLADIENFSVNTPQMSNSLRSAGVDKCIHPSISPSCAGRNSHQLNRNTNNSNNKNNSSITLVKTISNDQLPRQPDIIKLSKPSTLHLRNHTESNHNSSNSSHNTNYKSNNSSFSSSSQHFGSNLKLILKASSTKNINNSNNSSNGITNIYSSNNNNNNNNNNNSSSNFDSKFQKSYSSAIQHTLPSSSQQSPYVSISK